MSEHIKATIADLQKKLREQEETVSRSKLLINQLAEMAGMAAIYSVTETPERESPLSIQSDQFYGQPLATAVRDILSMRKNLNQGPATIGELFNALQEGGFAFETKNDENAKRGLRISITKNTALFHKLPNGRIGLLEWYPNAKKPKKAAGNAGMQATDDGNEDQGEDAPEDLT